MIHPCTNAGHEPRTQPATCHWCAKDLTGGAHHRNLNHGGDVDPTCAVCRRGELGQQAAPPEAVCGHRGDLTGDVVECPTCSGTVRLKLRACTIHGTCTEAKPVTGHGCCQGCPDRKAAEIPPTQVQPEPRSAVRSDPGASVGVVIGSYKWPALIDLQIRLIRETCGPVPILVSDDCSPGFPDSDRYARLTAICGSHPDVMLWPNAERIGHTGGDIAAYWKGVVWGASRGLSVVAKLSQRFFVTRPRWLQEGADDLLASGLPLATQRCRGVENFDLRTEAALFNVDHWNGPDVLERIKPRRYWNDSPKGLSAETVIYRVLQDLRGGIFWPWSLFGEERYAQNPGVLWHTGASVEAYRDLATRHGVELDDGFHVSGWQGELAAGTYLHG